MFTLDKLCYAMYYMCNLQTCNLHMYNMIGIITTSGTAIMNKITAKTAAAAIGPVHVHVPGGEMRIYSNFGYFCQHHAE